MATLNNAPFGKFGTCVPQNTPQTTLPPYLDWNLWDVDATLFTLLEEKVEKVIDRHGREATLNKNSLTHDVIGQAENGQKLVHTLFIGGLVANSDAGTRELAPQGFCASSLFSSPTNSRLRTSPLYGFGLSGSQPFVMEHNDSTKRLIINGELTQASNWHHVAIIAEEQNLNVYHNGVFVTGIDKPLHLQPHTCFASWEGCKWGYLRASSKGYSVQDIYEEAAEWLAMFNESF